jgi:uncharacterized protein
MALQTGCDAVDATLRSAVLHDYGRIRLKYAGGEPLLRFATVRDIHRYARAAADGYGVQVEGVVLSNGTLLQAAIIDELRALDLALVISLDGLDETHDCQRAYASGHGSAADVRDAIDLALAHGLTPAISITVSGRNAATLPDLVAWVLERDLPFGINFYREHSSTPLPDDLVPDTEQIIAGMQAAFRVIAANLPRRSLLSALVDHANLAREHRYPCNAGQHYLVFDHQGQVVRCQMQMQQPVASIEDYDPLALVRADNADLHNPPVEDKPACRACEWKYWCAGGCPLAAHHATGTYHAPSPYCAIYRQLYPEVLHLERLRMLQYGQE